MSFAVLGLLIFAKAACCEATDRCSQIFWLPGRCWVATPVVRNVCLYQPINFRFLVPKPCKTAKFSIQLNVFPMSPVFVTTQFLVQKALKTVNSEKFVFSCQTSKVVPEPPSSLVFRRKPAPDVCGAPIPFSAPKSLRIPARRARHRLSPLCHRSLFGCKSAQNRAQFPSSGVAGFSAARQPAKDQARSPTVRRGGPSARRACHR